VGYIDFGQGGKIQDEGEKIGLSNFTGDEITEEQLAEITRLAKEKKAAKSKSEVKAEKDNPLDDIIIFAVLIAIIPYSIDNYLQKRRIRRYEEEYSDFLFEISELMRGGIDPIKAVIALSNSNLGTITKQVKRASLRMTYGKSFEYSMKELAKSLKSNAIEKYTELVIHASHTGGNVSELILRASEDMKKFINLEREKEATLMTYTVILYMAQGILILLVAVFILYTLPFIQGIGSTGMGILGLSPGGGEKLSDAQIITYTFHVIIINAFFVGLIIGKMTEGSIKSGLKHTVILMTVTYLLFILLLMPAPEIVEPLTITPVSYPGEGFVGIPLKEPVVFKITDLKDNPKENVTVIFTIKGPGENPGKLKEISVKTDEKGIVSNQVTLGSDEGIYVVEASAGKNKNTIEIKAVSSPD
jgi:flagellar protein FlaJ